MLRLDGGKRNVLPVGEVTTTARIEPSLPVITWLTVPIDIPPLLLTLRPVVSPVRAVLDTAPRASTLLLLAWLMPFADAFAGPWLRTVACEFVLTFVSALVVGAEVILLRTLFGLAFMMPLDDAFAGPWLFIPAPAGGPPPCCCAKAGPAIAIATLAAAAINDRYDMILLRLEVAPARNERARLRRVCLGAVGARPFTFACHWAPMIR